MIVEVEFEAGGLEGANLTTPLTVPLGVNLPPFALARGSEYRWRAYVDGETRDSWTLPFRTTPQKPRVREPLVHKLDWRRGNRFQR